MILKIYGTGISMRHRLAIGARLSTIFVVDLYDFCRINTIFIRFLYDFSSTTPARRLRFLFPLRGSLGSL